MKSTLLALFLLGPTIAFGYPLNPNFETGKEEYGAILIEWKTTNDPVLACNTESSYKAYHPDVLACAVRRGLKCTIYTKRQLNLAILGHEIRHCYEGDWHGRKDRIDS